MRLLSSVAVSLLLRALPLLLFGCALGPGSPEMEVSATLGAAVDRAGRETADGWLRLSSDYQLRFEALSVTLEGIDLQRLEEAGGGGTFDPENPPAGYACHGGHCHTPDERTLTYEEIAAELSGGGGYQPVLVFSNAAGALALLDPVSPLPLECAGGCGLPHGVVTRVGATVPALHFAGRLRDGRSPPRFEGERSWSFSLPAEDSPLSLSAPIELVSDRSSPSHAELELQVTASPVPFDEMDWAALAPADTGELTLDSEANHERLDELLGRLQTDLLRAGTFDLDPH